VAEAFPRRETLTFNLQAQRDADGPYHLRSDGCGADYLVSTTSTAQY
jgi:hypothetical protein